MQQESSCRIACLEFGSACLGSDARVCTRGMPTMDLLGVVDWARLRRYLSCPKRRRTQGQGPQQVQFSVENTAGTDCMPTRATPKTAVAGMLSLPETLQAEVFQFSGIAGLSSLCLSCTELHRGIWESACVWQQLVSMKAGLTSTPRACSAPWGPATHLRDQHRWQCYGIDALCSWHARPPTNHAGALMAARRAVSGLIIDDAPCIDLITMSIADLVRWYDATDAVAKQCAEALVHDAAARPDVFHPGHLHELSSALADSQALGEMITSDYYLYLSDGGLGLHEDDDALAALPSWFFGSTTDSMLKSDEEQDEGLATGLSSPLSHEVKLESGRVTCDDEAIDRMFEALQALPRGLPSDS